MKWNVAEAGDARRAEREQAALRRLADLFEDAGWKVRSTGDAGVHADLLASRPRMAYAVELKFASEARSDRLVPLLSQAILQTQRSQGKAQPLAVVVAPRVSPRVAESVLRFAREYAPNVAVGVIDLEGFALFQGVGLESLNALPQAQERELRAVARAGGSLFTDLNQWLLKVLVAPELPERLLSAPRGRYRNATELARAAGTSVMSAFRFLQQLGRDGYLEEGGQKVSLVRRRDLFERWQSAARGSSRELPMRLVVRGDVGRELRSILGEQRNACLALFAAADALGLGHVQGVPSHVYVERLPSSIANWDRLRPCVAGEAPDVIVRQAPAPRSIFRAAVREKNMVVCDVVQVWLDVAAHPSRGAEQARVIEKKVLERIIEARD